MLEIFPEKVENKNPSIAGNEQVKVSVITSTFR